MRYKKIKTLHVTPLFYAMGNASEDIYFGLKRAIVKKYNFNILYPFKSTQLLNYKICNEELFKLSTNEKKHFQNRIEDYFFNFIININFILRRSIAIILRKYLKIKLNEEWYFPQVGFDEICPPNINNLYKEAISDPIISEFQKKSELYLQDNVNNECLKKINKYGIDLLNNKFVCLHLREGGYHNDKERRPYRNANIENYIEGINYLLEKGLYVIRLGDTSMKKCNLDNNKFIDYPFTKLKSASMDLYLIKNCEFYIGMQSGPADTAMLFEKPMLTLNMYTWFHQYPFKEIDRGLFKKMLMPNGKIIDKLKDRVRLPFHITDWRTELKEEEVVYIENDNKEILLAIKEFWNEYNMGFINKRTNDLIENFNLYRKASDKIYKNENHVFYKYPYREISREMYKNIAAKGCLYEFN